MIHKDVIIIGAGIAGLSAANILSQYEVSTLLIDRQPMVGGTLIKQTHPMHAWDDQKGFDIIHPLYESIQESKYVDVILNTTASAIYQDFVLSTVSQDVYKTYQAKAYIVAAGSQHKHYAFENNDLPGIMPSSVIQTMMHTYGILPRGDTVIIGSGNHAYILTVQLMEAGVSVKAIVDMHMYISADEIYVSKIKAFGIPIYVHHQVLEAMGKESLEAVKIIHIKDGEETLLEGVSTLCVAGGMSPATQLLHMAGVKMTYEAYLGGFVPTLNAHYQTSHPNIFACGDVTGIEDARVAMYEGTIAGLSVLKQLGMKRLNIDQLINTYQEKVTQLKDAMHHKDNGYKEGPYVL